MLPRLKEGSCLATKCNCHLLQPRDSELKTSVGKGGGERRVQPDLEKWSIQILLQNHRERGQPSPSQQPEVCRNALCTKVSAHFWMSCGGSHIHTVPGCGLSPTFLNLESASSLHLWLSRKYLNKCVLSASLSYSVPSASPLGTAPLCWWLKAHWRWDWDLPHAGQEGQRSWHTLQLEQQNCVLSSQVYLYFSEVKTLTYSDKANSESPLV